MKRIWTLIGLLCTLVSYAQIGIGTSTVDNSAVLQLNSTSKGLLVPKMSSGQRTGIVSPANGLLVYDTDANQFYFYNGTAWVQAVGPAGSNGTNGTNGKTVLNGTTNPTGGTGTNGDFYLNASTSTLFGPKAAGSWPAGVSLIGADGTNGTNGATGATGKTILSGSTNPSAGTGTAGDFYLNTSTSTLFGPKTTVWPAGVSLIGPTGPSGIATNASIVYSNAAGLLIPNSNSWTMVEPITHITIGPGGALVNVAVTLRSNEGNVVAKCNICYGASSSVGPWFPILTAGGAEDIISQEFSLTALRTVTLTGKVIPSAPGTWWIGPCFKSPSVDLVLYGGMGYVLIPD